MKKASIRYGQTPCIGDCEAFLSETRMPTSWTRQSASFGHAASITRGTRAPPLGWTVQRWIHLTDVVGVLRHALTSITPSETYNTVAPQPARHRELAHEVGRHRQVLLKLGVPAFAARLMAGQMAEELLLSGQNVIPERLLKAGFAFEYPDLSAALDDLMP